MAAKLGKVVARARRHSSKAANTHHNKCCVTMAPFMPLNRPSVRRFDLRTMQGFEALLHAAKLSVVKTPSQQIRCLCPGGPPGRRR